VQTNQRAARLARAREWLGAVLLSSTGCEVTEIEVERSGEAVIPESTIPDEVIMDAFREMDIVLEEFSDLGVEDKDLSDAVLTDLEIVMLDPPIADFTFARRIDVFAVAPGLERTRIAFLEEFPPAASFLTFETDGADISEFLASDEFSIVAVFTGGAPDETLRVQGNARLNVGVTMAGACNHMFN